MTYSRIICLTRVVWRGTANDPKRPAYASLPESHGPAGIIAFTRRASDDGNSAIGHLPLSSADCESFLADIAAAKSALATVLAGKGNSSLYFGDSVGFKPGGNVGPLLAAVNHTNFY